MRSSRFSRTRKVAPSFWTCAISMPISMATNITLEILSIGDRFRLRRFRLPRHFILCGGPNESPSWVWTNLPAEAKLDLVDPVLPERQDVSGIHRHFRQEKGHANPWATA